ncbi:MAG: alpha amylase C-terminal domain-containing protein, partial [Planctomycetota bacterium]
LNRMVLGEAALHQCDHDWRGFAWIDFGDVENSSVSFVRYGAQKKDALLFVFNFTPIVRSEYRVGVPRRGEYEEVLNTDAACYGGSGVGNLGSIKSEPIEHHEQADSLLLTLPPLAVIAFRIPAAKPVPERPVRASKRAKRTHAAKPSRKREA